VDLHVEVDAGDVVCRDDPLELLGDRGNAGAAVGQFGAVGVGGEPAEGRHDVATGGADARDGAAEGGGRDRHPAVAVPHHGARADRGGLQERHGQELRAGLLGQRGRVVTGPRLEVRREHVGGQRGRGGLGGTGRRQDRRGGGAERTGTGQERGEAASEHGTFFLPRWGPYYLGKLTK